MSTYKIQITTTAQRPHFFFGEDDEINLNPSGSSVFSGQAERSFGERVAFKIRIVDVEGTDWELLIKENGTEVHKQNGTTDRPNFVLRGTFQTKSVVKSLTTAFLGAAKSLLSRIGLGTAKIGLLGVMLASAESRLTAQALLQSGDGKSSFFNEATGSLFLLNFGDKSIEFNQTYAPTRSDFRFGIRLKGTASEGFAGLFDSTNGFLFSEGQIAGYVGWYWETQNEEIQFGLLNFRIWSDLSLDRGTFSLATGSGGGAVQRTDSTYNGLRERIAANALLGRVGPMNVALGGSVGYGRSNNYKYLPKLQFCSDVASSPDGTLRSCKDARSSESYVEENTWTATGDLVLWQPKLVTPLGVYPGIDLFARYDPIRDHEMSYGAGVFLAPKGKPQTPFGGLTFERYGSDWKIGLQAGVAFGGTTP